MAAVLRTVLVAVWRKRYSVEQAVDELCGRRNGNFREKVTTQVKLMHDREITVNEAAEEIACIIKEGSFDAT